MCYMKYESAKNKVVPKSKAEEAQTVSKPTPTISTAKKSATNADLNVQKQNSVKKVAFAKKVSTLNVSTQSLKKKAEKNVSKISSETIKGLGVKTIISIKKVKSAVRKAEPKVSKRQIKQKIEKTAPKIPVKKIELKVEKAKIISSAKIAYPAPEKLKTIVSTKIIKPTAETKQATAKNVSSATKIISGDKKLLSVSAPKINVKTSFKPVQVKVPKPEIVAAKKTKAVEAKLITVNLSISKPPKKKKIKPISSAIFRGKKERYSFEVFSLTEEFESVPAVFVISRRKTDKLKKAHHSLVCIGQTNSIFDELKKHRKGKCVKKHQANVVSILPEANEKIRLRIETDLKAAHSVACSFE